MEQFGKGEWAGKGWWCSKKAGAHPRMVLQKGESTAALVFFPDTQLCGEGGGARRGFLFQLNLSEVARDEGFSQTNKLVIDFLFYIYLYIR